MGSDGLYRRLSPSHAFVFSEPTPDLVRARFELHGYCLCCRQIGCWRSRICPIDGPPLPLPICQYRSTKGRTVAGRKRAAGNTAWMLPEWQTPLRQDVDERPRGNLICNRKIRQHGEPRALAHSFAHGERGIEKNCGLHLHDLAFDVVPRETPPQVITQGSVGDEREIGNVCRTGEPALPAVPWWVTQRAIAGRNRFSALGGWSQPASRHELPVRYCRP